MAEGFSRQLQESLLALLVFDDKHTTVVRAAVQIKQWDQAYRDLAMRIYEYVDKYRKAPKDHAPEILDDLLQNEDLKLAARYERILNLLHEIHERGLNPEYLIGKLHTFVRRQAIKNAIIECSPIIQTGRDDRLEEVEKIFNTALATHTTLFDPGTRLSDRAKVLNILEEPTEVFMTGIDELDKRKLGVARKGLHLLLGPAKGGKSWWLGYLSRMAALTGKRVVHVTLEMSERLVTERYIQTFFALAKRKDKIYRPELRYKDPDARRLELKDRGPAVKQRRIKPDMTMDHPKFHKWISRKMKQFRPALDNVYVKEFPTGELTLDQLEAYLDMLETTCDFVPDILVLDYPDLMDLSADNFRLALQALSRRIRGMLVRRNIGGAIVSQIGRMGAKSNNPKETDVAEDWSKIAIADVVLVLQQTAQEKQLGLARLYVSNARSEQDKFTILITQSLATGQFALTSQLMPANYLEQIISRKDPTVSASIQDGDEE